MKEDQNISVSQATANILSAFASREHATVDEVINLARSLPRILAEGVVQPSSNDDAKKKVSLTPISDHRLPVAISSSVTEDYVVCLCCGRELTMLKRHLRAEHGLTEAEYRQKFNLAEDHLLVAPSYSNRKAATAKRVGLGKYSRDSVEQQSPAANS